MPIKPINKVAPVLKEKRISKVLTEQNGYLITAWSEEEALEVQRDDTVAKIAEWIDKTFSDGITKAQMLATNTWQDVIG